MSGNGEPDRGEASAADHGATLASLAPLHADDGEEAAASDGSDGASVSASGGRLSARPPDANTIYRADCRSFLPKMDAESVQLTVTSPPYNIGKDYGTHDDDLSLGEWRDLIEETLDELFRVTVPDGKVCINVGFSTPDASETGRYFRIPLRTHIVSAAVDAGFDFFDEYVWVKNTFASHGGGTLFGSYPHPTNLMANQKHEYILVFRKWVSEDYHGSRELPPTDSDRRERSELDVETWREYTQSVWEIDPAAPSQLGIDHGAMFPVEVPRRLIEMYSFADDLVLDPFIGTGTTAVAARECDRRYIGIERQQGFADAARARLAGEFERNGADHARANRAFDNATDEGHEQCRLGTYDAGADGIDGDTTAGAATVGGESEDETADMGDFGGTTAGDAIAGDGPATGAAAEAPDDE